MNFSRSALIVSASVVGIPLGNPCATLRGCRSRQGAETRNRCQPAERNSPDLHGWLFHRRNDRYLRYRDLSDSPNVLCSRKAWTRRKPQSNSQSKAAAPPAARGTVQPTLSPAVPCSMWLLPKGYQTMICDSFSRCYTLIIHQHRT